MTGQTCSARQALDLPTGTSLESSGFQRTTTIGHSYRGMCPARNVSIDSLLWISGRSHAWGASHHDEARGGSLRSDCSCREARPSYECLLSEPKHPVLSRQTTKALNRRRFNATAGKWHPMQLSSGPHGSSCISPQHCYEISLALPVSDSGSNYWAGQFPEQINIYYRSPE
ncbi:uncharacterized protein BO80DRAFT_59009 [Aspergillus ibericus CBS 121593]|uniref:Uncharacterized protein n=1 Tax=Aspergillus ibericus CBS 121593 TaxID=1448316 RepID=A0A395H0U7_9EURO|nr:hypothetical protein BO80DRAFT_59009 [Aspergillus ibericus CBS 121593]RAL01457.1 hypothetical protein BO80DRAFT_59009 [Aspergillus ibericus CBS 121593]